MKPWIFAAVLLVAAETAALACSCLDTDDPAQLRSFAPDSAQNAIALVEAEALTAFDAARGGEQMKVVRTLAGSAPPVFKVERGPMPSSASCDALYQKRERAIMILYPARTAAGAVPLLRVSSLCTAHLLNKPVFRDEVARLIGGPKPVPERGR